MKRNPITLATGILVLLVFGAMLFVFQVRQTEVAVVTTLGRYSGAYEPGPHLRLPWPIQNVYRFDNRIRNLGNKYEPVNTGDGRILLMDVFVGWRISDPKRFLEKFNNDVTRAEKSLEDLLRDAKMTTVSAHNLADFISPNPQELKFEKIEKDMLEALKPKAEASYGIEVALLGIKQIGLPEGITAKVFERMAAEREQLVKQFRGEGAAEAIRIRSDADRQRDQILAEAESKATLIRGEADAAAAKSLKVFEQDPELAVFLLKLNALERSLKERATLILDTRTPPFDLLKGQAGSGSIK
jgi:membrane protease subunit HflC